MKTIRIETKTIKAAAESAGMTVENFVSTIRSISLGRMVCAHFLKREGDFSVFICA